jgi:hypothetical protein
MTALPQGIKAVFVGDLNIYSKGWLRCRALRQWCAVVEAVPHTPPGDPAVGRPDFSLAYRVAFKLGYHLDTEDASRKTMEAVDRVRPDLVWIEKGTMIRPQTLRRVKEGPSRPFVVSYSDDNMALPHNHSRAYVQGLPYYDCVFTTKARNAEAGELPALGARRVVVVDKAFDPESHRPILLTAAEEREFGADCGFIGTYERERAEAMLYLARNGVAVRVWGNGWEAMTETHPNLRVERRAVVNSGQNLSFTKTVYATKVNLGFLRKMNFDTQTDRSVEIPACGGFLLAERTDDHRRLFCEGEEAVFFSGLDELLAKVRHYLAHDDERRRIAAAGRARCLSGGYSHAERVRFMLAAVFEGYRPTLS